MLRAISPISVKVTSSTALSATFSSVDDKIGFAYWLESTSSFESFAERLDLREQDRARFSTLAIDGMALVFVVLA